MSKNKNYQNFYKKNKGEKSNVSTKEVQTTEEVSEAPKEEAKTEEQKVEVAIKGPEDEIVTKVGPSSIEQKPAKDYWPKAKVYGAALVNMRENPSTDGKVIEKLKEGTVVIVGESKLLANTQWRHIKYGEKTGFMMAQFLKEI